MSQSRVISCLGQPRYPCFTVLFPQVDDDVPFPLAGPRVGDVGDAPQLQGGLRGRPRPHHEVGAAHAAREALRGHDGKTK